MERPIVKLCRNPWSDTLSDGVLLMFLQTAAMEAAQKLAEMIESGEVEDGRDSLGVILLDPTRPRSAIRFLDRVLATIQIGPNARKYLPNAAAKADAHDRHGVSNGELVAEASHCLGNEDFAWGNSAEYDYAIGGVSGLAVEQDEAMALLIFKGVIDRVRNERDRWLEHQRREGNHRWYNQVDAPGAEYLAVLELPSISPAEV